jgi:hypothetical protein
VGDPRGWGSGGTCLPSGFAAFDVDSLAFLPGIFIGKNVFCLLKKVSADAHECRQNSNNSSTKTGYPQIMDFSDAFYHKLFHCSIHHESKFSIMQVTHK